MVKDQAQEWLESTRSTFLSNKGYAEAAIGQTSDANLRVPLDENTNSIAVIMKHVGGNLRSRWTDFLTSDGEKSWRNRDTEFIDDFEDRTEIVQAWEAGWTCLFQTLDSLSVDDLERTVTIRGEAHSVPLAIQRSLGHTTYHVGQIVMVARVFAKDAWETISIPRGESEQYNRAVWGPDDAS